MTPRCGFTLAMGSFGAICSAGAGSQPTNDEANDGPFNSKQHTRRQMAAPYGTLSVVGRSVWSPWFPSLFAEQDCHRAPVFSNVGLLRRTPSLLRSGTQVRMTLNRDELRQMGYAVFVMLILVILPITFS
ncbi:hypothetical protein V8C43DRAFT_281095 [Trichoderma afarasin]